MVLSRFQGQKGNLDSGSKPKSEAGTSDEQRHYGAASLGAQRVNIRDIMVI